MVETCVRALSLLRRGGRALHRRRIALLTSLLLLPPMLFGTSGAAFTATTVAGGSSFAAAASFPGYPQTVIGDAPALYHRQEEAVASGLNTVAADGSGAGRPGTYSGATNGPSLVWPFEEGSGTVTADASGAVNQGSLTGATWHKPGRMGAAAVGLDGVGASVQSARPGVATANSFTVMTWVYLTDASQNRYALGQEGTKQSVFGIHSFVTGAGACSCWSVRYVDDTDAGTGIRINSNTPVALNTWVHLTMARDATNGRVNLWVNGEWEKAGTFSPTVNATGPLSVGRVKTPSGLSNYWKGAVDEVRTYGRVLTDFEIRSLYQDAAPGHWGMNEAPGETAAADVLGRSAALGGDATFAPGHYGNALHLDGTNDYALTSGMSIDTNKDYSVAAWLYLTDASIDRHAVAAEGNLQTAFAIQANATTRTWRVRFASDDSPTAVGGGLQGTSTVQTGQWTHVAFVRSGSTGQLYVNGVKEDDRALSASWDANARLSIGRQLNNGTVQGLWKGAVDEVRLYQRPLAAVQVTRIYKDKDIQYGAGMTGGLQGPSGSAVAFGGWIAAYNNTAFADAGSCTVEAWFRAGLGGGGQFIGFSSSQTSSTTSDRVLYLDSGGRLSFGVGTATIRSAAAYDDTEWHHAAASVGPAGLRLWVDGVRVATDTSVTSGPAFSGYWRWGGALLSGRPNRPANDYFVGTLDEVAVYPSQLSDQQIAWHHGAGR
ncbi:LamG domain-containing protein [Actinoplanes sp. NPDC051346]|uniref:LamG domain-containing protein n=1 Tax=Actinoplanes sp. NPDC051346 TaxID=3155048 RepID=UPI0034426E3A